MLDEFFKHHFPPTTDMQKSAKELLNGEVKSIANLEIFFEQYPRCDSENEPVVNSYNKLRVMLDDLKHLRSRGSHSVGHSHVIVKGCGHASRYMPSGSSETQSQRLSTIRNSLHKSLGSIDRAVPVKGINVNHFKYGYDRLVSYLRDEIEEGELNIVYPPMLYLKEALLAVHDKEYIKKIASIPDNKKLRIKADLIVSSHTLYFLLMELFVIIEITHFHDRANADLLWFHLASLPTHHAGVTDGEGFCVLNTHGILSYYMMTYQNISRFVVLDTDVNDGHGTREVLGHLTTLDSGASSEFLHLNCVDSTVYPCDDDDDFKHTYQYNEKLYEINYLMNPRDYLKQDERDGEAIMHSIVMSLQENLDIARHEGKCVFLCLSIGWDSHLSEMAACAKSVDGAIRFDNADVCHFYAELDRIINANKDCLFAVVQTLEGGYTSSQELFHFQTGLQLPEDTVLDDEPLLIEEKTEISQSSSPIDNAIDCSIISTFPNQDIEGDLKLSSRQRYRCDDTTRYQSELARAIAVSAEDIRRERNIENGRWNKVLDIFDKVTSRKLQALDLGSLKLVSSVLDIYRRYLSDEGEAERILAFYNSAVSYLLVCVHESRDRTQVESLDACLAMIEDISSALLSYPPSGHSELLRGDELFDINNFAKITSDHHSDTFEGSTSMASLSSPSSDFSPSSFSSSTESDWSQSFFVGANSLKKKKRSNYEPSVSELFGLENEEEQDHLPTKRTKVS